MDPYEYQLGSPFEADTPQDDRRDEGGDELAAWRVHGFLRDEWAAAWLRAGVEDPSNAVGWQCAGITPPQAWQWIDAGVVDPAVAYTWEAQGDDPSLARRWTEAGCSPAEAGQWRAAGYHDPSVVAEWTSIGVDDPAVAQEWADAGFTAETAALWVEVEDMTPSAAMAAINSGTAPVDIERVRRAEPDWTRPVEPPVAEPDMGVWL
jgi:hypothetical protein